MKMRKRIAALIAAAMIVSLMPMSAFAASTNRVSQIVKVTNDGSTSLPQLKMELKDNITTAQVFYLKLENAEWDWEVVGKDADDEDIKGINFTANNTTHTALKGSGDKELAVPVDPTFTDKTEIIIPLKTKSIKGEATVEIVSWDTPVTEGKYVFATSSDKKAIVTVGDAPSFYTGTNKIAKFTLEESALDAFASAKKGDKVEITLDNDDFEFTGKNTTMKLGKGFAGITLGDALTLGVADKDDQRFVIEINDASVFKGKQRGTIEIELEITHTTRKPELGDLMAEFAGELVESKDYKIATIAEYGVELKSEKDYEFVAGQIEKVEFHLNEIVDDSMVNGRETEFILPKGIHFEKDSIKVTGGSDGDATKAAEIVENAEDNKINGFSVKLPVGAKKIDKFKFEAKLQIPAAFEGDVVLKAEGRSIGEELEVKLAEIEAPVKVTVESMKVKPGFKEQVGGKIIIEETDKARLMQGKKIVLSLDGEDGMFLQGADVDVTKGDLRKGDVDVTKTKDGKIEISIKRRSKEASTIEITNVEVKLDRRVPQGFYDIKVGGSAISKLAEVTTHTDKDGNKQNEYGNDNIIGEKFIIVGDPITGTKSEVTFKIGSEKFTVDGVEHTMDAAAYIKDGRTMVPLRFLATALGIEQQAIQYNKGIVTIFVGNGNVVQVQIGSKELRTNGMVIPMAAAAEIVGTRTYVPVTEIGGVFGVSGTWDAATQTATFK